MWFVLNGLDIMTTYAALSTGMAEEANFFMRHIIGIPAVAIPVKMMLAFAAAKIVERMAVRNTRFALTTLVILNLYIGLVCVHNTRVYFMA